ncbi:MAG: Fe-S cluster assembly protein SufD [Gammaproteobacteria bacterium]|jgi:Fe-S cluster assembly protein SufD
MTATSQNQPQANTFRELWDMHSAAKNAAVLALQQRALESFVKAGFPTTRLENWKYTDVRKLAAAYPDWLNNIPPVDTAGQPELLDIPNAIHIAFVDGKFRPERSARTLPSGLLVGSLDELAEAKPDLVNTQLGKLLNANSSGMVALNTAFTESIIALTLPEKASFDGPLYITHYSSTAETSSHPRLLVNMEANSTLTVIEHFSGAVPTIVNSVSEMYCASGAAVSYYKLQQEHAGSWHLAEQSIRLEHQATANTTTIDCGARLARNQLTVDLAGEGAHLNANGLLLADAARHIDSRINVEHNAPNTRSRERYRAILADKARGVFNGRILVNQNAQKTVAELTNRNLLLNKGAEIDTKPELEIYADDVKCAHGSTTGQLDQNALFYLLARGIDKREARNLLVRAFAAELLTGISVPAIAERTQTALQGLSFGDT